MLDKIASLKEVIRAAVVTPNRLENRQNRSTGEIVRRIGRLWPGIGLNEK
jgi:hypothetical protein